MNKEKIMSTGKMISEMILLFFLAGVSSAAQDPNNSYVTRQEYNNLTRELEALKSQLYKVEKTANTSRFGGTKLLIAGDAAAGFFNENDSPSSFTSQFNPMFLLQLNNRLFFEGGLELAIEGPDENGEGSESDFELDSAYFAYFLNNYITLGAGKFSTPFTVYHRHFDPTWINKLPFDPLAYADGGIAPDSSVGVFAIGAAPINHSIINYAAYLSNGPALITNDPASAGSLNFDNYSDQNYNKAFGFRLGYLPVPELEVGYSFEFSKPNPGNFQTVHSYLHGLDLNYVKENDYLRGRITGRFGWVWSQLQRATYPAVTPSNFNNDRNGGYAEVSYRPTKAYEDWINNLEFALRFDRLNVPSRAPSGGEESRWIPGIDYWLTPRTVLKAAYAFDNRENGEDNNIFAVQLATGF
jgi:hypothetical protein